MPAHPTNPPRQPQPGAARYGRAAAGPAVGSLDEERHASIRPRELRLFAIAASLAAHLALGLVLALLIIQRPVAGIDGQAGEVPLATMVDVELQGSFSEVELATEIPDALGESAAEDLPTFDELVPLTDGDLAALRTGELTGLDGAGEATGSGATGSGSGGAASFFGVEAYGSRFAFIVDVSGSMAFDRRLSTLQRELREAVSGLLEHTHFSIFSFSSRASPVTGVRWVDASDAAKRRVMPQIDAMNAAGGTYPDPAFQMVFQLRPRPDAIYFMTDGAFEGRNNEVAELIAQLNDRGTRRVPIHCITLVNRDGEEVMRRIARESGGSYTHVEGTAGP